MTNKPGKLAAVGDKDSILAFRAAGADVFAVNQPSEADGILKRLSKEQYSVIFITEKLAAALPATLAVLKTRPYPAVVPIPCAGGVCAGFAKESLKRDVERAIGTDIVFNPKENSES